MSHAKLLELLSYNDPWHLIMCVLISQSTECMQNISTTKLQQIYITNSLFIKSYIAPKTMFSRIYHRSSSDNTIRTVDLSVNTTDGNPLYYHNTLPEQRSNLGLHNLHHRWKPFTSPHYITWATIKPWTAQFTPQMETLYLTTLYYLSNDQTLDCTIYTTDGNPLHHHTILPG